MSEQDAEARPAYTEAHAAFYPEEYLAGIDLYNEGEFHAAHDAWEERWRDDAGPQEKLFLQGMIQAAVIFHHLEIGRPGAARRMYQLANEKFARLGRERFMSLDLREFLSRLERELTWLIDARDPREVTPPDYSAPPIRLLPELMEFD